MKHLFLTTALAASVLVISNRAAQANCAPVVVGIACSANDLDGFASADDNVIFSVDPGGFVQALDGQDAVALTGQNAQVTIDGTVTSDTPGGVDLKDGLVLGDGAFVTLNGILIGGDDALNGDDGITFAVNPLASVTAKDKGLTAKDDFNLTVFGSIFTVDEAVEADDKAFVNVETNGTVTATTDDAIQIEQDATIINSGMIVGDDDGIDVDSGAITNSGTITAIKGAGIDVDDDGVGGLMIMNRATGKISGGGNGILVDPAGTQNITIENEGAIEGGVALASGNDSFTMAGTGSLLGRLDLGDGDDFFGLASANVFLDDSVVHSGGAGTDTFAITSGLAFSLMNPTTFGPLLSLEMMTIGGPRVVSLTDFEIFQVDGAQFDQAGFVSLLSGAGGPVAPIPLPAGVFLLGGALGALALRRRG